MGKHDTTRREEIVVALLNSRTHEGGARFVANLLGVRESRVDELVRSWEQKLAAQFRAIEENDPERAARGGEGA